MFNLLGSFGPSFLSLGGYVYHLWEQCDLLTAARIVQAFGEAEPMLEYEFEPVRFAREVLGVDLWADQEKILMALVTDPRVSVAACYASGKTYLAAIAVLWWMCCRRPALCITTAPTQRQVRDLLWRYVNQLYEKSKVKLPGKVFVDRFIIGSDRMAKGYTGRGENSVAGVHEAKNVLFIEDEAAGIEKKVEEGFAGVTSTPGSRHLKIGNPLCESGPFFDSHMHPVESLRWRRFSIDALDTPNVKAGKEVFPGLVGADWVADKRAKWLERGIKSLWETKVRGRFWVSAQEKVVPIEWATAAQGRWAEASVIGHRTLGCDIAGGGQDATELCLLEGQRARIVESWQEEDLTKQGRDICAVAIRLQVNRIVIDRTGLGQGVYFTVLDEQRSGRLPKEIEVIGVKLYDPPEDKNFNSLQDEIQFFMRDRFDPKSAEPIAIDPADAELREQITLRNWWKDSESNKIRCTGKKQMKKDGKSSPDKADALSLCCIPVKVVVWKWVD